MPIARLLILSLVLAVMPVGFAEDSGDLQTINDQLDRLQARATELHPDDAEQAQALVQDLNELILDFEALSGRDSLRGRATAERLNEFGEWVQDRFQTVVPAEGA